MVTAAVALLGFLVLAACALALGALVTNLVVGHSLGHGDADVARWFADRRTPTWSDLSLVGSYVAETVTVFAVAGVAVVILAWHRCWPQFALIVVTLLVEAGVYLVATYFVSRNRPAVPRLEHLINSDSFPSGHTAASVALYGSLAIVVWSLTRKALWRRIFLALAVVAPIVVATSRVYRGMHNVTDVMSGALLGAGCVAVGYVAVRAGMESAHERRIERAADPDGLRLEEAVLMTSVAVVAHAGKTLGDGLSELRRVLADAGVGDPIWYEVSKSKYAPKCVQRALGDGADLLLRVGRRRHGPALHRRGRRRRPSRWRSCLRVPATCSPATSASRSTCRPRSTSALHGARRTIDVGRVNGERFAVMAGTGLDALMIRDADRALKGRFGRAAYVWTGAKHLRLRPFRAKIDVDGARWFDGATGCVLVGNVRKVFGGIEAFDDASPEDGRLELGVVTAKGIAQWTRALVRTAVGSADQSKFVRTTKARKIRVKLDRKMPYELDGGDEKPVDRLKIRVEPAAITVCVPEEGS